MSGSADAWTDNPVGKGALFALAAAIAVAIAVAVLPVVWAGLLVAGAVAVTLIIIRPQIGLVLVLIAVPFGSLAQVQLRGVNVGMAEALVALVLGAWLMRLMARGEIRLQLPWLALPLVLFLGVLSLSLLVATSLQLGLKELVKWLEVLALYLFVAREVDERWQKVLIAVLLGTGALAAVQGIVQFVFQVGPEGFRLFDRFMRAYGTFEQPNPYAGYLGLTLPVAVGLVAAGVSRLRGRIAWPWLAWAAFCGALMAIALVMSWSRGAWLGAAAAVAAVAVAAVVRGGRGGALIALLGLLAVCVVLAAGVVRLPSSLVLRMGDFLPFLQVTDVSGLEVTDANYAVLERMAHWQAAGAMWADHLWLGVGAGNYELLYPHYALPMWPLALGHAHNYYLNIAAETGLLGLCAYLVLWATALAGAWRATQRASGWQWGVALGILGVIVHLTVHNAVDNLYVHGIYLHLAILLGMVPVLFQRSSRNDERATSH